MRDKGIDSLFHQHGQAALAEPAGSCWPEGVQEDFHGDVFHRNRRCWVACSTPKVLQCPCVRSLAPSSAQCPPLRAVFGLSRLMLSKFPALSAGSWGPVLSLWPEPQTHNILWKSLAGLPFAGGGGGSCLPLGVICSP